MGKEKAEKFIIELAAMKPVLVESMLPARRTRYHWGDADAITFVKYVFTSSRQGAPLDYVRLDRMLGDCHFAVLNNKAPHPNAGKAFLDYYLDDESIKILAENGEFVNRKGIYSHLPGAERIQYVQMENLDAKAFEQRKREYGKIFLR